MAKVPSSVSETDGVKDVEKIRAFVAIDLPPEVRERLGEIESALRGGAGEPGWVRPENIHLTLKFIGDVDTGETARIAGALEEAAGVAEPFPVTLGGLEIKNQRMLWLAIEESEALGLIKEGIERELAGIGYEREARAFRPHLTLLRVRRRDILKRLITAVKDLDCETRLSFTADGITLYSSELAPGGARYTVIKRVGFKGRNTHDV